MTRTGAAAEAAPFDTHQVVNQARPLENYNAFTADRALVDAVAREGGGWIADRAAAFGALAGSAEAIAQGFLADRPARMSRARRCIFHSSRSTRGRPAPSP